MATALSIDRLSEWILRSYQPASAKVHCIKLQRSVAIPGGNAVHLLSVRHYRGSERRVPEQFVAELWDILPGPAGPAAAAEMFYKLGMFRSWYAQILEDAELRGLKRRHRFSLHANLVAPSVDSGQSLDLLSHYGGELAFWTCQESGGSVELFPHYAAGESETANGLTEALDHLVWDETTQETESAELCDPS